MSLLLDDSEAERDFVLCSRKGREEEGASPNRCFVSAVLSVTQYNSKSRIRARSNIQIFTELMTASIVYRSKSIMYSIHSTLMLYNRGGKLSHNINACHGFRRAGVVGARRCENYDRT